MGAALMVSSEGFGKHLACPNVQDHRANFEAKLFVVLTGVDALVFITGVVLGPIGLLGVLSLPAALSYTLIGFSGLVVMSYLVLLGRGFKEARLHNSQRSNNEPFYYVHPDALSPFKEIPSYLAAMCSRAQR